MEAFVTGLIAWIAMVIDVVTGIVIGFAVLEATVKTLRFYVVRRKSMVEAKEEVRLTLGKWLVLALEFTLAADILT